MDRHEAVGVSAALPLHRSFQIFLKKVFKMIFVFLVLLLTITQVSSLRDERFDDDWKFHREDLPSENVLSVDFDDSFMENVTLPSRFFDERFTANERKIA